MAISKKYSRRIVVDGITYRWRVPPDVDYDQTAYDGILVVDVWLEEDVGQLLRLIGGPRAPRFLRRRPTDVITPRRLAVGIRSALAAGWNPAVTQPIFHYPLPTPNEQCPGTWS
jgi:hypothetical protein